MRDINKTVQKCDKWYTTSAPDILGGRMIQRGTNI